MPVKLENVSGNGSIQPNTIFGYSYSEEVNLAIFVAVLS